MFRQMAPASAKPVGQHRRVSNHESIHRRNLAHGHIWLGNTHVFNQSRENAANHRSKATTTRYLVITRARSTVTFLVFDLGMGVN
jgi:hypothetical protein